MSFHIFRDKKINNVCKYFLFLSITKFSRACMRWTAGIVKDRNSVKNNLKCLIYRRNVCRHVL